MKSIRNKLKKCFGFALAALVMPFVALVPQAAVSAVDIDINASDYGYGDYIITVRGTGMDGVYDEEFVAFSYYPVYAEATEDDEVGGYVVDLEYSADDGSTEELGEVAEIVINVYDGNGNLVEGLSPITVTPPTNKVELPFDDYGLDSGTYTISISAYNRDGEELYKAFEIKVDYEAIPVPDTGGLFQNLNISKTDYLVTGLLIFAVVGIGGIIFINKRSKRSARRRR